MIYPVTPVSATTPKSQNGAEDQQRAQNTARPEAAKGADVVAQTSAVGTVEIARTAKVTAPEAMSRPDPSPPARPAIQTLSLPTHADARSIVLAIASDREPQVYGPDADMAAQKAAAERERIMSRAQAIVEAVMSQDRGVKAQDPYSAAKSGRHI